MIYSMNYTAFKISNLEKHVTQVHLKNMSGKNQVPEDYIQ